MKKEGLLRHLKNHGFSDSIVGAFGRINREDFVPDEFIEYAYEDQPLPIGLGQTISQPYTIAFMLGLLELKDNQRILEVGSGSGYVLALMNEISKNSELFGVEVVKELAEKSQKVLGGKKNIKIVYGDGSKGLPKEAPFDRILVSAAAEELPQKLVNQLDINGILVAPVRNSIVCVIKKSSGNEIKEYPGFSFVPLVEREKPE